MQDNERMEDARIESLRRQLQSTGIARRRLLKLFASGGAAAVLAAGASPPTVASAASVDEVDATTLNPPVIAESQAAAADNARTINEFFKYDGKLVLPPGTIYIKGTINLLNRNHSSLRGRGILATILQELDDCCLINMAGSFNSISDMMLDGSNKAALCGLYVQGYPQPGITAGTHLNTFRNLYIQHFRVGIRVGHNSALDDDPGDGVHPDIVANLWQGILLDFNRYGLVRDGATILNDHFENFVCQNIDRYHVYLPVGGDFRCYTAQFGSTLESDAYSKIYSVGSGAIFLSNARSENGDLPIPQPPFLTSIHAETFVELHEVVITNEFKELDGIRENLQVHLQGGRATLMNCDVWGTIRINLAQYIGLNNQVGRYDKQHVSPSLPAYTIIFDAAVGSRTPSSVPNTTQLEVTDLLVNPTSQVRQSSVTLHEVRNGELAPQSSFTLKNDAGTAVVETKGLNTGKAGDVKIRIDGAEVLKVSGDPGAPAVVARTTDPNLNGVGLLVAGRLQMQGSSVGQAIIPAGQSEVMVFTPAATPNSTVLLTPLSELTGLSLWVGARAAGSFMISANRRLAAPITVQYLIVN